MRKKLPAPEPIGFVYCFKCERMLPSAAFRHYGGIPKRPCKACTAAQQAENRALHALTDDLYSQMLAASAARPTLPQPVEREFAPMDGMALWLEREARKARKRPTTR